MATYKNTNGDYYIDLASGNSTLYLNGKFDVTGNVDITGNLSVAGNVTYIDVNELTVDDPFITVAANNSGTLGTATFPSQGLVTQTSGTTFAGLRFNNTANTWQICSSVYANGEPILPVDYVSLSSGSTGIPGGNVRDIQINDGAGGFTANGTFQYDIANTRLILTGHQVLSNIGTAPTAVANSVAIYNNAPGAGATGLYTVGTTTTADEVISLTRARLYAIIF